MLRPSFNRRHHYRGELEIKCAQVILDHFTKIGEKPATIKKFYCLESTSIIPDLQQVQWLNFPKVFSLGYNEKKKYLSIHISECEGDWAPLDPEVLSVIVEWEVTGAEIVLNSFLRKLTRKPRFLLLETWRDDYLININDYKLSRFDVSKNEDNHIWECDYLY